MKKIILVFSVSILTLSAYSQFTFIGLKAGAGFTIVDIEEAVGWNDLEDWDNFGAMFKAVAGYRLNNQMKLVGEVGSNRLYYWEHLSYYGYYQWRAEWTTNLNVFINLDLGKKAYFLAGGGIHAFNDGSGVVPGLATELGYIIKEEKAFSIPITFRVESVFGNALPVSILLGTGFNYHL